MKVLAWFLSILMLIGLTSCSVHPSNSDSGGEKQHISNDNISEDEILKLMRDYLTWEYYTAYESMEVDTTITDDSGTYFAVINEEYDTWEEWTSFCESIFYGDALKKSIDEVQTLKNIDGKTYCSPGSMGWNISNEYEYKVVESTLDRAMIQISRQESLVGEDSTKERIWFYNLYRTNDGWRIVQIISFT